jgi:hypothetical protein
MIITYNFLGEFYGDLPDHSFGWAAVFVIFIYRFCRVDDYFWRDENS